MDLFLFCVVLTANPQLMFSDYDTCADQYKLEFKKLSTYIALRDEYKKKCSDPTDKKWYL